MNKTPSSMAQIVREVKRLDPSLERDSDAFKAACCLLAALQVGGITQNVAEFTGYPDKLVRKFSARLRESGVWKRGRTQCNWFDKKIGTTAFWMDVAVAIGYLRKTTERTKRRKSRRALPPITAEKQR